MSSILSSDLLKNIGSFLPNKEKHRISFLGNYEYSVISQIVTYSYNEYIKHNEHNKHNKIIIYQSAIEQKIQRSNYLKSGVGNGGGKSVILTSLKKINCSSLTP
jgi:hypothetical protein